MELSTALMEMMNNYVTWMLVHLTVIVWDIVHNVATKRFNTYIPYITTENMNFLSLGFPSMQIPNLQNISLQPHLLILDMSNSVIMDVCLTLSEAFGLYHSIMVLWLQFNNITYVSNRCFFRLIELAILELHGDPVKSLLDGAFQDIPLLYLTIGHTKLSTISGHWLQHPNILQGIDIRELRLQVIGDHLLRKFHNLNYVNDYRLCYVLANMNMCSSKKRTKTFVRWFCLRGR